MKNLPNINIDPRSLNRLFMTQLTSGGEAIITRSFQPNTLFKIFADYNVQRCSDSFGVPFRTDLIEMSDNKFEKIKRLHEIGLEHIVKPVSTLSMGGRLIGYEMTYDKDDKSITSANLSIEETSKALEDSRQVLEYFKEHDITYGDVNSGNILVNKRTGQISFCDIDNMRIGTLPIDVKGKNSSIYGILGGKEENLDAYMHNIMTLYEFGPKDFGFIFSPVSEIVKKDYSKFLSEDAKETLQSMEEPKNFNGEYVIQYVKK